METMNHEDMKAGKRKRNKSTTRKIRVKRKNAKLPTLLSIVNPLKAELKVEPEDDEVPPPGSEIKETLRCLVCYCYCENETSQTYTSSEQDMYKIFNIKRKKMNDTLDFPPPVCHTCSDILRKTMDTLTKLEELENIIEEFRKELRSKLVTSFEEHVQSQTTLENETMMNVEMIRQDVVQSVKHQMEKQNRGKPGRPRKNPYVLIEPIPEVQVELKMTKTGRIVKPPNRLTIGGGDVPSASNDGPTKISAEDGQHDLKIDHDSDEEHDENDMPDPDWFPINFEEGEEEDQDEDDEEDEDYKEAQSNSENEENPVDPLDEGEITHKKSKKPRLKRKHPNQMNDDGNDTKPKRRKRIKKSPNNRIPIKVVLPSCEILKGCYIQKENQQGGQIIKAGSTVEMPNKIPGVLVLCTEEGCVRAFSFVERMRIHVKKVHEGVPNPYECPICQKIYPDLPKLMVHAKQHEDVPDWLKEPIKAHVCSFDGCTNQYRSDKDLQIHIRSKHTLEKPFTCDVCQEGFVSMVKLDTHIEQKHPEIPPFKCSQCPKAFFRTYRLRDHMKAHTGERSFLCEICSKSFSQQSYLKYHQTQHEELELEPYKCDECDRTFASPVNLRVHKRTQHERVYRYHCEVCNHGADQKCHLRLHMLTHSGERPYACDVCDKTFSRQSQLTVHVRSHTGERPYVCKTETCGKTFTNSSKLRRHELTHAQVKPFLCTVCGKGFCQMTNLNSHIKTAHSNKAKLDKGKLYRIEEAEEMILEEESSGPHPTPQDQQLPATREVFQSQVFGIQSSQNFTNIPIQFQVVSTNEMDGDGPYAEFIIVNQI